MWRGCLGSWQLQGEPGCTLNICSFQISKQRGCEKAKYRTPEWFGTLNPIYSHGQGQLPGIEQPQFPWFKSGFTHLHLQHLLEPLHDDQGGFLNSRITVLGTVFYYFHQGFIGRTPQVILVSIRSATEGGRFAAPSAWKQIFFFFLILVNQQQLHLSAVTSRSHLKSLEIKWIREATSGTFFFNDFQFLKWFSAALTTRRGTEGALESVSGEQPLPRHLWGCEIWNESTWDDWWAPEPWARHSTPGWMEMKTGKELKFWTGTKFLRRISSKKAPSVHGADPGIEHGAVRFMWPSSHHKIGVLPFFSYIWEQSILPHLFFVSAGMGMAD